jgi:hypothetical protein
MAPQSPRTPKEPSGADHGRQLRQKLRAAWIITAEDEWRRRTGRPMTLEELERVLRRYPGDV